MLVFIFGPLWIFFANFHWNMSRNGININNLCCNTVFLKKILKLLNIAFYGLHLGKIRATIGHTKNQVQYFF